MGCTVCLCGRRLETGELQWPLSFYPCHLLSSAISFPRVSVSQQAVRVSCDSCVVENVAVAASCEVSQHREKAIGLNWALITALMAIQLSTTVINFNIITWEWDMSEHVCHVKEYSCTICDLQLCKVNKHIYITSVLSFLSNVLFLLDADS